VDLGLAMCRQADVLRKRWVRQGGPEGVGVGIAKGVATLGAIGFESRVDYAAIGTVTNLAARLCAEANTGELFVSDQVWEDVRSRELPARAQDCSFKGFTQVVRCYRIDGACAPAGSENR
jgi:class 3 adenylate cyclase